MVEELIALAKEIREADHRDEDLGLTEDETAFYDALETNDSAVKLLGDQNLRFIAQELVKTIRENVTIDWFRDPKDLALELGHMRPDTLFRFYHQRVKRPTALKYWKIAPSVEGQEASCQG